MLSKLSGSKLAAMVVEGPRLVVEVVFDDAVGVAGAAGIEAHLEVLVVDLDVVETKIRDS